MDRGFRDLLVVVAHRAELLGPVVAERVLADRLDDALGRQRRRRADALAWNVARLLRARRRVAGDAGIRALRAEHRRRATEDVERARGARAAGTRAHHAAAPG